MQQSFPFVFDSFDSSATIVAYSTFSLSDNNLHHHIDQRFVPLLSLGTHPFFARNSKAFLALFRSAEAFFDILILPGIAAIGFFFVGIDFDGDLVDGGRLLERSSRRKGFFFSFVDVGPFVFVFVSCLSNPFILSPKPNFASTFPAPPPVVLLPIIVQS